MSSKIEELHIRLRRAKARRDLALNEARMLNDEILALEIDISALETEEKDIAYGSPD